MNKLEVLAEELIALLRKDPTHPNAGRFAEAVAHLTVVQSAQDKDSGNWAKVTAEIPGMLAELEEKMANRQAERQRVLDEKQAEKEAQKNKPPTPLSDAQRQLNFEAAIAVTVAQSVARSLIQEATGFEQIAELGRASRDFGHVTEGALVRPTLDADQRQLYRKQAAELRARAVQVLMEGGCDAHMGNGLTLQPY